jgi:hypothetical protein
MSWYGRIGRGIVKAHTAPLRFGLKAHTAPLNYAARRLSPGRPSPADDGQHESPDDGGDAPPDMPDDSNQEGTNMGYEDGYESGNEEGYESGDVLGAIMARRGPRPGGGQKVYRKPPLPPRAAQPDVARLRSYMGFGFVVWTAADATDKVTIVEPQESFRGERFIADVTAAGGTSAGLTLLRRIDIGTQPQSPSVEQPAPLAMFARDATSADLDLQVAFRSTKMQITLGITAAPGAGVTVTAAMGFFGEWIR